VGDIDSRGGKARVPSGDPQSADHPMAKGKPAAADAEVATAGASKFGIAADALAEISEVREARGAEHSSAAAGAHPTGLAIRRPPPPASPARTLLTRPPPAAPQHKDNEAWAALGGAAGAAAALDTSLADGVADDAASLAARRAAFGANRLPAVPPKNFFVLWVSNLKDPILIMLMVAALVSTVLGAAIPAEREENAWTEGVAIWVAVLVVSLVGAGNDWNKDRQFQKLNAQKDLIDVKVVRGGRQQVVPNVDLVVGDVVLLDTGDKVRGGWVVWNIY
jgi:hypothetical protein